MLPRAGLSIAALPVFSEIYAKLLFIDHCLQFSVLLQFVQPVISLFEGDVPSEGSNNIKPIPIQMIFVCETPNEKAVGLDLLNHP